MKDVKKISSKVPLSPENKQYFFDKIWNESWVYVRTIIDVTKQPALVLDKNFTILAATESFYNLFQTNKENTIDKKLSELGNGQWDISELKTKLGKILTADSFFSGFEVTQDFPTIGVKVSMLTARQINYQTDLATNVYLPFILLTFDDVTEIMSVADSLAQHMNQLHHLGTHL